MVSSSVLNAADSSPESEYDSVSASISACNCAMLVSRVEISSSVVSVDFESVSLKVDKSVASSVSCAFMEAISAWILAILSCISCANCCSKASCSFTSSRASLALFNFWS